MGKKPLPLLPKAGKRRDAEEGEFQINRHLHRQYYQTLLQKIDFIHCISSVFSDKKCFCNY